MRDELERLLKQREEEEETVPEWLATREMRLAAMAERRRDGEKETEGEKRSAEEPAAEQWEREKAFFSEMFLQENRENNRPGDGEKTGMGRARALYEGLARVRRAARFSQEIPATRPISLPDGQAAFSQLRQNALQLDRAFQRDARRYDGGFTWQ